MSDETDQDASTPSRLHIDPLIAEITNLNLRLEKHGEEDRLAIDISLYCEAESNTEETWQSLHGSLLEDDPTAEAVNATLELAHVLEKIPFSAHYRDHMVTFWVSTQKIAKYGKARVHSFVEKPKKGKTGVAFKVSSICETDDLPELAEYLIDGLIRLEIQPAQKDLFDEHDQEPDPSGDDAEGPGNVVEMKK